MSRRLEQAQQISDRLLHGIKEYLPKHPHPEVRSRAEELKKISGNKKLLSKLDWHRGPERISSNPLSVDNLAKAAQYHENITSSQGTKAKGIISPLDGASVYEHTGGRYKGLVVATKGGLDDHYKDMGGPISYLGLPIADEYETPNGWRADFENGSLVATKDPWSVTKEAKLPQNQADILATWTERGLKKYCEPNGETVACSPSPHGATGVLMHFRDVTGNPEPHIIIKHETGKYAGEIAYLNPEENQYYRRIGGTTSELGFPIAGRKTANNGTVTIPFERGNITHMPDGSIQHKLTPPSLLNKWRDKLRRSY